MLVIPAIDLRGGRCVRLTQGRKGETTVYDADPLEVARGFERAGARMLHVVDLDGAFGETERASRDAAREIIRAVGVSVQLGGGLRTLEEVSAALEAGAARIVVGTLAVESPETLAELVRVYGARIAVGIDARDGWVLTRGWERQGRVVAVDLARRVAESGCTRIVYTDVARDGMLGGVNVEQTCAVARAANIPVTASGGVAMLEDITRLKETVCGIDSVIVGKALYEGRFTLREALDLS